MRVYILECLILKMWFYDFAYASSLSDIKDIHDESHEDKIIFMDLIK